MDPCQSGRELPLNSSVFDCIPINLHNSTSAETTLIEVARHGSTGNLYLRLISVRSLSDEVEMTLIRMVEKSCLKKLSC